jgi:hypothetical protein
MRRRHLPLLAATLAAGALGGALLAGCGSSGTETVSAPDNASISVQTTATTPTTTTSSTSTSSTTTTPTGTPSGGTQGPTATRTASAPAFTHTTSGGEGLSGAAAVVRAHGYTPNDVSDYHPTQTLRVLVGTRTGTGDGYDQQAFFFVNGTYIGTDSSQPSATVRVVKQGDTEVTLAYPLYRPHDALCCPSAGQANVRFQLNDGRLVPLDPIPPASSQSGLSRQ